MFLTRSLVCSAPSRFVPSSSVICGRRVMIAAIVFVYLFGLLVCIFVLLVSVLVMFGWVVNGLEVHSATSVLFVCSVCMRFVVFEVTCRYAFTMMFASGCSWVKRSRIERRMGICPSVYLMRAKPDSVPIVICFVGVFDRHVDVLRLLGCQLGQPRAERVEVQLRDFFVEVLG